MAVRPFDFWVQDYSGWSEVPGAPRAGCIEEILAVLVNPCLGTRLRDAPGQQPSDAGRAAWSEFCKVECHSYLHRVIYRWVPPDGSVTDAKGKEIEGPLVLIEAVGPHRDKGKALDVYRRLRTLYKTLPDDSSHTKAKVRKCCDTGDIDAGLRSALSVAEARRQLLRS